MEFSTVSALPWHFWPISSAPPPFLGLWISMIAVQNEETDVLEVIGCDKVRQSFG
jgi:hypothetical protein